MEITAFGKLQWGDRFRFALTNAKPGRWVWVKIQEEENFAGDKINYQREDGPSADGFAGDDTKVWHLVE